MVSSPNPDLRLRSPRVLPVSSDPCASSLSGSCDGAAHSVVSGVCVSAATATAAAAFDCEQSGDGQTDKQPNNNKCNKDHAKHITPSHQHTNNTTRPSNCSRCGELMPSHARTTRASNALNSCRGCHVYTGAELATHTTKGDLWISLSGGVYNVTPFVSHHPGGILPLLDVAGCDASDVFAVFHPAEVRDRLPGYQVGVIGEFDENDRIIDGAWDQTPLQAAFHGMIKQLEADGQFETDFAWYWKKVGCQAAMLAVALGLIFFGDGSTLCYALSSIALGFFWQQLAFLGHDLGHNSVRGSVPKDWFAGLMVTAFFGVSVQWWKRNHNVHHVVTNSLEHDPDIQHLPIFSISSKAFKGFYSTYFEKMFQMDAISRFLVARQHFMYYPVMCVARWNLYAQSFILLFDPSKHVTRRACEFGALVFYWTWYIYLFSCLPNGSTRFWYLMLSHAVAGLVHVQITLSHFSMPVYEGRGYSSQPLGREHFIRTQLETSLDVECTTWMDWLHGGLQYQATHHLMPRAPRNRLRHIRNKYVKPFAEAHGLTYHGLPFVAANMTVYRTLEKAANESKQTPTKFTDSYLWQLIQARG